VVIDGGVTGGTRQGSTLTLGNVLEGSGVTVSLGQTEVDTVDEVTVSTATISDKVGWLDITVDQVTRVHKFNTLEHLIRNHEDGLEGKTTSALVELILKRRSEEVHYHEVIGILGSEVVDLGESRSVLQLTVDLVLVTQLRTPGSMLFELDGYLLAVSADSEVNVSKGPSTNTLGDSIFRDGRLHGCSWNLSD